MQLEDGVVVYYTAKAKSGKEQELREALTAGVTGSRYDTGCIIYELHEFTDDPSTFFYISLSLHTQEKSNPTDRDCGGASDRL